MKNDDYVCMINFSKLIQIANKKYSKELQINLNET